MYIENASQPNVTSSGKIVDTNPLAKEKLLIDLINLVNTGNRGGVSALTQDNSIGLTPGRANANTLYPYDIEVYAIILDLVDSAGVSQDIFQFPVMPNNFSQMQTYDTSIDKTMSGIVSNNNPSFNPIEINIAGTFGRGLKFVNYHRSKLGNLDTGADMNVTDGSGNFIKLFDKTGNYRTGFNCYKLMEYILNKSKGVDQYGNPYKLLFYNLSLGNNYLVEVISLSPSQNRDSNNMMWNYALSFRAIAPAENVFKPTTNDILTLQGATSIAYVNKRSNSLASVAQARTTADNTIKSRVQTFIERQAKSRVLNIFNNNQQAAITAAEELIESRTNSSNNIYNVKTNIPGEFSLNVGESIINKF